MALLENIKWADPYNGAPRGEIDRVSAKMVAEQAQKGDPLALEIMEISAVYLGRGLSILIDILNPDCIVLGGSIYARNVSLFLPVMEKVIAKEALYLSRKVCRIKPAELGENIGDYAAVSIASDIQPKKPEKK